MKKVLIFAIAIFSFAQLLCQTPIGKSNRTTIYKEFKPAVITLIDGKTFKIPQANIFLKNSHLVYKKGNITMQAMMDNIKSVSFDDRVYFKTDTVLAYIVDTINSNKLLLSTVIDIEAYKRILVNNNQITNISLGDQIGVSTIDVYSHDDMHYPLINCYYFDIKGKCIPVHERTINRELSKEKRRLFKAIMQEPDFNWGNTRFLMQILQLF
jgi:hypothetical protein